jgi:hypothetical protein
MAIPEESEYAKERSWRHDVREFAATAKDNWRELVGSSMIAVVLGVLATVGFDIPRTIAGIGAFGFVVVVACFLAWRDERRKVELLEQQQRPRLSIECGRGIAGSFPPINWGKQAMRIVVHSLSQAPITNCHAYLVAISKGTEKIWDGDKAGLTFAPAEKNGTKPKTIHPKTPEFIDVLYVGDLLGIAPGTEDGGWNFGRNFGKPRGNPDRSGEFQEMFSEPGDYYLIVQIVGDMPTETVRLKFTWPRNRDKANLEKVAPC